jgi:hypothetical protein
MTIREPDDQLPLAAWTVTPVHSADLAAGRREQIVVAAGGACVRVASVAADLGEAALEVAVFDVEVHRDLT